MGKRTRAGISRRGFMASTVGAVTLGAARGAAGSPQDKPVEAHGDGVVDQNPIRRRGVGLRALNPAKAWPGLTLFAPTGGKQVLLIDLRGNVVHSWDVPYQPGMYGYLTERGTLFYNGQIPNATFIGKQPFMGGSALEMDWNGKILWEVKRPDHHHDGRLLKNGNIVLMCGRELPPEIAKRVRGGRAGSELEGGAIWSDYLVEMTTRGEVVWEWPAWEHLDPEKDAMTEVQDSRSEWTHGNSVWEDADGNLLVSFRNISTIVRVERKTGNILWKLGAPPLAGQHAPHGLADGNLLIFDNGPHRLDDSMPHSSVIEVNPATKAIVWQYHEPRLMNFFSPRISNAQRLPNGNTLINEGNFGRFFEVTRDGEVVWEYVNPHFGPDTAAAAMQQNGVFRAYRYSEDEIDRMRRV